MGNTSLGDIGYRKPWGPCEGCWEGKSRDGVYYDKNRLILEKEVKSLWGIGIAALPASLGILEKLHFGGQPAIGGAAVLRAPCHGACLMDRSQVRLLRKAPSPLLVTRGAPPPPPAPPGLLWPHHHLPAPAGETVRENCLAEPIPRTRRGNNKRFFTLLYFGVVFNVSIETAGGGRDLNLKSKYKGI